MHCIIERLRQFYSEAVVMVKDREISFSLSSTDLDAIINADVECRSVLGKENVSLSIQLVTAEGMFDEHSFMYVRELVACLSGTGVRLKMPDPSSVYLETIITGLNPYEPTDETPVEDSLDQLVCVAMSMLAVLRGNCWSAKTSALPMSGSTKYDGFACLTMTEFSDQQTMH